MAAEGKNTDKASLAETASDQIRAIVEAAEQAATTIRTKAEEEARQIRAEAEEDASGVRRQAQSDIRALLDSIRGGVTRVSADLEELEARLDVPAAEAELTTPEVVAAEATPAAREPATAEPVPAPEPSQPPAPPPAGDADLESARLVALNMALDGADREEVDQYLRENFELTDRKALLDEVYASVGA